MPEQKSPSARTYIITGSRGAGKTHFCQQLALAARRAGLDVAGVLSLPVFDGVMRVQIVVEDLRSGQTRLLATRKSPEQPGSGIATLNWQFDSQGMAWGRRVLAEALPSDVLIVDELGPLEFEREQGWLSGLAAVDSQQYSVALVVVRPELLGNALLRWPEAYIVEIDTPEDSQEKAQQLARLLFF